MTIAPTPAPLSSGRRRAAAALHVSGQVDAGERARGRAALHVWEVLYADVH